MKPGQLPSKQEYRPPKLCAYGDLTAITRAASSGSKNDHNGGKFKST